MLMEFEVVGIYKIENKINHKVYIGQSWNIERRIKQHKNIEKNDHLKRSFDKYGIENFSFDVLVTFENISQRALDNFEDLCMKKFNSLNEEFGYNKKEAGSNGKHTKESKEKMSKKATGRIISEETKKKMSEAHKSKRKYNARKVKCVETGEIFETITAAANFYGLKIGCIQSVCRGKSKATGGYKWKYVNEMEEILCQNYH